MRSSLRDFFFTIDTRSLALYRIGLGLLLLYDAGERWIGIEPFYTVSGVMAGPARTPLHWSLLDLVHTAWAVRAVFLVAAAAHVALLLGWRTRIAHAVALVFLVCARNRNPLLSSGADAVLLAMTLWTFFLPLGARWSLDARRRGAGHPSPAASEAGLAALVAVGQIAFVYFTTAVAKSGSTWRDGSAVYYALQIDQFITPIGRALGAAPPALLMIFTYGTLGLEYLTVGLVFVPWLQPLLRRIAIVTLIAFHLGTWAALVISSFPFVMIATYALLLQPADWEILGRWGARWLPRIPAAAWAPGTGGRARLFEGRWANLVVAMLFASAAADGWSWTYATRTGSEPRRLPLWLHAPALVLDLRQGWRMFAPDPLRGDGWWVVDGVTESGAPFDPLRNGPPEWGKPAQLAFRRTPMWRMYLFNVSLPRNMAYWPNFSRWLAGRTRPNPPERRLQRFEMWWVQEDTQPPGVPKPWPVRRYRLWSWDSATGTVRRGEV